MKKVILLLFFMFISSVLYCRERVSVLFLVSYDSSFPPFHIQYHGIIKGFENNNIDVDLHIEFLDSKRFPYDDVKQGVYNSLKYKIRNWGRYDYIITADDNALRFVNEYEKELFHDTPVVFFGVNDPELALRQNDNPLITGFIEEISYQETVQSIKKILPDASDLYILYDSTSSGSGDYKRIMEINDREADISIHYLSLSEMSFEELYNKISSFNVNQPVLLLSAFVDKNNRILDFYESVKILYENSGSPVFHLWGHGIGSGLIGGKVVDHGYYGELSAELISRLIAGGDIREYRVSKTNRNRFMFDNSVLEKLILKKTAFLINLLLSMRADG